MRDLRAAEDELERALHRLERHTTYADLLAESTRYFRATVDKERTDPEPFPRLEGAAFRAWAGSGWVETVSWGLESEAVSRAVDSLIVTVTKRRQPGRGPPGERPSDSAEQLTSVSQPPDDVSVGTRLKILKDLHGIAMATPGIFNAFASMEIRQDDRWFASTSGARRYQSVVLVRGTVVPLVLENGKVEYDFITHGELGGMEVLNYLTEERIRSSAKNAVELLRARPAPTGQMPVVLDPSATGTFAHESFGHGTEADQLLRDRSYLKPLLGQTLGPESLSIVDEGRYPRGWGSIYFDDEGIPAQRTVLVDHGRFVGVLHDSETAAAFGRRPTGNSRRADFLSRAFVRMTNTYVEAGDWSLDELVEEANHGVLLETTTSGIEDPLGGQMQIKVKRGRAIEHGRLGDRISSMALSGKVLEVLRNVRGVGQRKDFQLSPGYCGKGHTDLLPTGTGGSYLLTEAVVGPA